jgi:hypothetical protein
MLLLKSEGQSPFHSAKTLASFFSQPEMSLDFLAQLQQYKPE